MTGGVWPADRAVELIRRWGERLADPAEVPLAADAGELAALRAVGHLLRSEPEEVEWPPEVAARELRRGGPVVLSGRGAWVGVLGGSRRWVRVVGLDGRDARVPVDALVAALSGPPPAPVAAPAGSDVGARLLALVERDPPSEPIRGWRLRPSPGVPLIAQLDRPARRIGLLAGLHAGRIALVAGSWWLLGRAALAGTVSTGVLLGWGLLVGTSVLATAWADDVQGRLLVDVNVRYRRKILHGATRLTPDVVRTLGSGQLLGRVFETEALDGLAVAAAVSGLSSAVDLAFAAVVLAGAPGMGLVAAAFAGWVAGVAVAGLAVARAQRSWTLQRVAMTEELVENLLGRRTRLAQLGAGRARLADDAALDRYLAASRTVDRAETAYEAVAGRGWLVVGLACLGWIAVRTLPGPATLAAALGGVLLGMQALGRTAASVHLATALVVGWRQARVLYRASAEPDAPTVELGRAGAAEGEVLLRARGLSHHARGEPVLRDVNLTVGPRERVLLTGASGSGKTTLARLLAGLERPSAGAVSLRGLDPRAVGAQWCHRVAYVPPFSDNHVFSASFLFNLFPGHWPAPPGAHDQALEVCRELGLGELVERMPAGLEQIVGETGWRLSHGEQSRMFLARALLQRPELVVLDESFGALDAETLEDCLAAVLRRAPSVVLISHA